MKSKRPLVHAPLALAGLLCLGGLAACDQPASSGNPDLRSPAGDGASASNDMTGAAPDLAGGGPPDLTGAAGADMSLNPGERTLDSCTTSIDPNAPAFYKTYFKCVTITMSGTSVVIATTSQPPHRSSYYGVGNPNYVVFDTRGGTYRPAPNTITAQSARMTIPAAPVSRGLTITAALVDGVAQNSANEYPLGPAGTAIDSVHIYNDLAAPGMTLANEQFTFDTYNAHPAPSGDYHYHTSMPGALEVLLAKGVVTKTTPGSAEVELYGIMCDGTVILGCTELDGTAPQGTLDAQGGHTTDIKDKTTTHFTGRYHTHVCPGRQGFFQYTPEIQFYNACTRQ